MRMTQRTDNAKGANNFSLYAQQQKVITVTETLENVNGIKARTLHGYNANTLARVFEMLPTLKGKTLVNGGYVTNVTTRRNGKKTVKIIYYTFKTNNNEKMYFAFVFGGIVNTLKGFERCGQFDRYNATLFARVK